MLPHRCSRDGGNIAPALEWSQVPDGTAELAVLCEDPDAPNGTFVHWVVSNIPPTVTRIGGGDVPDEAVESRNDFGDRGWGGPHPPAGDEAHRYFFRVFASEQPLGLGADATADDLRDALAGHELARGNIVGLFQR
ncbi:YbhB/YbcL family Raf kinase inhibitor-like protein [Saccharopolyspora erythraea]|nr:YbhB/YbcL family Raf kinase inhibitor-like protein [Saccharopolyspora erythraea]